MILFDRVSFSHPGAALPTLQGLSLEIAEGELCLVTGATGSGKSTLLGLINGLVPHFTGGTLHGSVVIADRDTRTHRPRDFADLVGVVGQDPLAGFVADTVEDELAYGMEQLGVADATMRKRVEEVIDLLGLDDLRGRPLAQLSGGEQQRVAIAAVLTNHPQVLVLDEPTSALDPTAAEEVLAAIVRLVHDLGVTVVLAEHRLERVIQYADSIIHLHADGTAVHGEPEVVLAGSRNVPPVIELGRLAGWSPLPLSVRDARRLAGPLRARLSELPLPQIPRTARFGPISGGLGGQSGQFAGGVLLAARRLSVTYGRTRALDRVDLELRAGEVTALMGRNGSGKSSLLWALEGSGAASSGSVARAQDVRIALVPHSPGDVLYLDSVSAECADADGTAGVPPGTTAGILERIEPGIAGHQHPRDLSEGQRLALALSVQLAGSPCVLLLDEPTRGLDYGAKSRLAIVLGELAAGGAAILLSSHDVEFVANVADRVVVLSGGEIVADGSALDVLTSSPSFAPQLARILRPLPVLNLESVRRALEVSQ